MKPTKDEIVKETKAVKTKSKGTDTTYILDLIDKCNDSIKMLDERVNLISDRLDLTGERTDTLSQGMDQVSIILDRIKNRMGL